MSNTQRAKGPTPDPDHVPILLPKVIARPTVQRLRRREVRTEAEAMVDAFAQPAEKRIPPCPVCGVEKRIPHPFRSEETIRVLCDHQYAEVLEAEAFEVRKQRHLRLTSMYGQAFTNTRLEGATIETLDDMPAKALAKAAAKKYLERFATARAEGAGLILIGDPGTGKSYLAAAIANALEARQYFTVFTTAPDLVAIMRQADKAALYLEMIQGADLVVVDDLGADAPTEFTASGLFRAFDLCYRHRIPMIVTSNLGGEELEAHYVRALTSWGVGGQEAVTTVSRLMSRMRGSCASFEFVGEDQRQARTFDWMAD